jgi:lipopolysaccharide transport system ATP-binding protein
MSDWIIKVENLGKRFSISHKRDGERYTTLRDVITRKAVAPFRAIGKKVRVGSGSNGSGTHVSAAPSGIPSVEDFWALKDVSFEVNKGDVVGIIGRNGAGKSTLLKILSRITAPSEGRVRLRGRVASLLEVGTGFHPELTGRENIFLNGSILGMSHAEVRSKFDEIVAFAEVEKFLDTPVKRYSSGMYVRLAFAVAAHLEPEILIVDEVLSVGDTEFQKKSLGKMEDVSKGGRTVLFVSHNLKAVSHMCTKALLLRSGQAAHKLEDVAYAIRSYTEGTGSTVASEWVNSGSLFADPRFTPRHVFIGNSNAAPCSMPLLKGADVWLYMECDIEVFDPALQIGYELFSEEGTLLFMSFTTDQNEDDWPVRRSGNFLLRSKLPLSILNDGNYRIEVSAGLRWREWFCSPGSRGPGLRFGVVGISTSSSYWTERRAGVLAPLLGWEEIRKPASLYAKRKPRLSSESM